MSPFEKEDDGRDAVREGVPLTLGRKDWDWPGLRLIEEGL
jgi:hypothetical protein